MTEITTIGLDLAKSVFQVHGIDATGRVIVAKALRRGQMHGFFAKLPPCLVGMEACGTSHYWAREIAAFGHTVKLIPPQYVKGYLKRGKTDATDAFAICEAVSRPSMTFVPVKTVAQQAHGMLHSARQLLISQRTQSINALRSHLAELGHIAATGYAGLTRLVALVRDPAIVLPPLAMIALECLIAAIENTNAEIVRIDAAILAEHKASEQSRALQTIPSVGVIIASAVRARVTDPAMFRNGRHFAAWLGLVPEQKQSGGKASRTTRISKKGDRYLRQLLVSGAIAVIQHARTRPDKHPWLAQLLARMPAKKAAVALANKTARIIWAIMVRGGVYQRPQMPTVKLAMAQGA